jgi:hypothetical protein
VFTDVPPARLATRSQLLAQSIVALPTGFAPPPLWELMGEGHQACPEGDQRDDEKDE